MPFFSVILPVYNGEAYLQSCINSVLNQSERDFELIIGNDGSTDSSAAILKRFSNHRIRILSDTQNLGLFPQLNRLIEASRGDWIHFLCQDDVLEPNCLEQLHAFISQHPTIELGFSKYQPITSEGLAMDYDKSIDLPEILEPSLAIQQLFYHGCIAGNLSTIFAKSSTLIENRGFDCNFRLAADYELLARLGSQSPVGVVHQPLVQVRLHSKQLSRQDTSGLAFIFENRRIRQRLWPLLPDIAKPKAKLFLKRRLQVLEWHYGVRALGHRRPEDFSKICRLLGIKGTIETMWYWFLTGNNRWYRPKAPWVLPQQNT